MGTATATDGDSPHMSTGLGYDGLGIGGLGFAWGLTLPAGQKPKDDPTKQYVAGGPYWLTPKLLHTLPDAVDDLAVRFGPRLYRAMLTDATVKSAFGSLKLGVLDGGVSLTSPVKMPAWSKQVKTPTSAHVGGSGGKPDAGAEPAEPGGGSPDPGRALDPDQMMAQEVLDFCQRGLDRLGESLTPQLFSLLDAMAFGCKLAEVTCAVPAEGVDKGKLVLASVKTRPNWAWRFLVDQFLNVRGVLTWNPRDGSYVVADPGKFAVLTWMPEDSDPRGTSALRAAYTAWNLKVQVWPMLYAHLVRFGSPGIDIEMAPEDTQPRPPLDPVTGQELADRPAVSADTRMVQAAAFYKSGGTICHPFGSKVNPFEPQSDGSALRAALDAFDRQICMAVEFQARVAMEAKHGSKADSQTAQDTKGLVNSYGRELVAGVVRGVLRHNVRDNFGADAAERFTPLVKFGESDKQDQPAMLAAAGSVGYTLAPSQMQEMDAQLGVPIRDPEEDARIQDEAMAKQVAMQQALQPAGNNTPGADKEKPAPARKGPPA